MSRGESKLSMAKIQGRLLQDFQEGMSFKRASQKLIIGVKLDKNGANLSLLQKCGIVQSSDSISCSCYKKNQKYVLCGLVRFDLACDPLTLLVLK